MQNKGRKAWFVGLWKQISYRCSLEGFKTLKKDLNTFEIDLKADGKINPDLCWYTSSHQAVTGIIYILNRK